jgi:hypothetical protein
MEGQANKVATVENRGRIFDVRVKAIQTRRAGTACPKITWATDSPKRPEGSLMACQATTLESRYVKPPPEEERARARSEPLGRLFIARALRLQGISSANSAGLLSRGAAA